MKHTLLLCAGWLICAFPVFAEDRGIDTKSVAAPIPDSANPALVHANIDSAISGTAMPSQAAETDVKPGTIASKPDNRRILTLLKINGI